MTLEFMQLLEFGINEPYAKRVRNYLATLHKY